MPQKARPDPGHAMNKVTYVQRLATAGGTAPATACSASNAGKKEIVSYQAQYIFWMAK
ncbi:MAG: DUF3455 domain-containing protein [Thiobacillus sp.]